MGRGSSRWCSHDHHGCTIAQFDLSFGHNHIASRQTLVDFDVAETALAEFRKVLDEYPEGNKAPAAMLKIGLAEASLDHESAAIRALKTVVERYPGTSEAEHARAKLLSLQE